MPGERELQEPPCINTQSLTRSARWSAATSPACSFGLDQGRDVSVFVCDQDYTKPTRMDCMKLPATTKMSKRHVYIFKCNKL